jgi:bleomycin hydrolase
MKIIDNAIENGYSVAWDGDVSEKNFNKKKGYAIVPIKEESEEADKDDEDKDEQPIQEKVITQEIKAGNIRYTTRQPTII